MRAICGLVVVCIIFGLLCLINSVAANALFSLFVASNYVAWGVPILCRLLWRGRFVPGEFYTGWASNGIACIAVAWLMFGLVLSMFPSTGPNPSGMSLFPLYFNPLSMGDQVGMSTNGFASSIGNELHDRDQRFRLDRLHDVLLPVREEVVHRSEDDGRRGFFDVFRSLGAGERVLISRLMCIVCIVRACLDVSTV